MLIYNFAGSPFEHQVALAWAASLVLVTIVLVLNVIAQVATRRPRNTECRPHDRQAGVEDVSMTTQQLSPAMT